MNETRPPHRRWVGVLLSLLIPGAGLFLAGDRRAGTRWFLTLEGLSFLAIVLASLAAIPGLLACAVALAFTLGMTVWMLIRSYKSVPRLGLRGWILFLSLAGALQAVETVLAHRLTRPFKVPTGSMQPTIRPGDHLMVQSSAYWFSRPRRGDLVVFRTEESQAWGIPKGQFYVKRVTAMPGEKLQIKEGRLVLNGQPVEGRTALVGANFEVPYMAFPRSSTDSYVIPAGCYFVVGDNSTNSLDSRHFGAIARESIIGKATKIYWPKSRAGDLR